MSVLGWLAGLAITAIVILLAAFLIAAGLGALLLGFPIIIGGGAGILLWNSGHDNLAVGVALVALLSYVPIIIYLEKKMP